MIRSFCSAAAVAPWLALTVIAQQPAGSPSAQPPASAHSTKLLTGCLRQGDAAATYLLTHALPNPTPATKPTLPTTTTDDRTATYELALDTALDHTGPRA